MESRRPRQARIVAEIPSERVDLALGDRSSQPAIGDIVELDQGFIGPFGEAMGIVVCRNADDSVRWVADVLESEMELL